MKGGLVQVSPYIHLNTTLRVLGMLMTSLPCLILEPYRHTAVNGQQLSKSSEINSGISDQLNNIQTLPTSQKKLKVQVQDIQFTPLPKIPPPKKRNLSSRFPSLKKNAQRCHATWNHLPSSQPIKLLASLSPRCAKWAKASTASCLNQAWRFRRWDG